MKVQLLVFAFLFDGLLAVASPAVTIETGDRLHVLAPAEVKEKLRFRVENKSAEPFEGAFAAKLTSFAGTVVPVKAAVNLARGDSSLLPVADALPERGIWYVEWELRAKDGEPETGHTRFAVFNPVGPTKERAKGFLFGAHGHYFNYPPDERDDEVRGAALAGIKVLRIDMAWCGIEPKEGDYHWDFVDERLALFDKYGIEPQCLMGLAPGWAQKKDWKFVAPDRGPCGNRLPEDKPWRDFLAKMAARYKGRIRFYELYNEPDLIGFGNFDVNDFIRTYNAGADGVHTGDPDALALSGGFACYRITCDTKPDFYPAAVLRTADHFDALALHEHGQPDRGFYRNIDENWLGLLKKNGLRKPLYFTETAEDAAGGEDFQAACYFQKALFAWSRGALAHTWYKTRDDVNGSGLSNTWGFFTSDFYPKAVYAACAATTALYADAEFVRDIPCEAMRLLEFRAKGALVVAGWPHTRDETAEIDLKTDASRATFADLMGNMKPLEILKGRVRFAPGKYAGSLVLDGAAKVVPVPESAARKPKESAEPVIAPRGVFSEKPQFRIDSRDRLDSFVGFNPVTDHMLWAGPKDLSAKLWLRLEDSVLHVKAEVTDDVPKSGDKVDIAFGWTDGRRWAFSLAAASDGSAEIRCTVSPAGVDRTAAAKRIRAGIVRNGDVTEYTAGVPLDLLNVTGDFDASFSFAAFNFGATDDDTGVTESRMSLSPDGKQRVVWFR